MKTLLIVILMCSAMLLQAQTGYFVVIEHGNTTTVSKLQSVGQLEKVVDLYFTKSDINIYEFMKGSIFFEIRKYDFRFYVEIKRITKKGKFRKLNKRQRKKYMKTQTK